MIRSNLEGLATGIGSLPYKDVEQALDLVFKYTPRIPFWPQLPKRDKRESMVAQFSEGLPCLKFDKELLFNPEDKEKRLEQFYEKIINRDAEYFAISDGFASGLHAFYQRLKKSDLNKIQAIKCQITGPFTFAGSINDQEGKALLHDSVFMQAIAKGLEMKALWQINLFKKLGKDIILFIDEPYLACFGSAFTPINREDVVGILSEFTSGISREEKVKIGVHCCGNTDWSIFTDIRSIDVISFDAFGFLDKFLLYARELSIFLNRGGLLAWGIVPTEAFSQEIRTDILSARLNQAFNIMEGKGIEQELLRNRSIVTPSCGLGTLSSDKAEPIFNCLAELSSSLSPESI